MHATHWSTQWYGMGRAESLCSATTAARGPAQSVGAKQVAVLGGRPEKRACACVVSNRLILDCCTAVSGVVAQARSSCRRAMVAEGQGLELPMTQRLCPCSVHSIYSVFLHRG